MEGNVENKILMNSLHEKHKRLFNIEDTYMKFEIAYAMHRNNLILKKK